MKSRFLITFFVTLVVFVPTMIAAQSDQVAMSPSISQPLIREGTLAVRLANALKVGSPASEAEAETMLGSVGIAPRNGWIGDYPVTPDIAVELQAAVGAAADAGNLVMGREAAVRTFGDVIAEDGFSVQADTSGQDYSGVAAPAYPDSTTITDYYYQEGPPVVTYYAPPPYYSYLYSWVPYPFWWWNFWFPGFFVLSDFHVHGDGHGHGEHGEFVTNHFRDSKTGVMSRIDPVHRVSGGTYSEGVAKGWSSPSAYKGARAIYNGSRGNHSGIGSTAVSPSGNRGGNFAPSRSRTYLAPAGAKGMMWGKATVRTYPSSRNSGGSAFTQRSYSSTSGYARSFSQPSGGSWAFHSSGGGMSSFSGASRGSFGGRWRR